MTDREIIQALIGHDNKVTERFFFVECRPLFSAIMRLVFNHPVDYAEMVNELYGYLLADDGAKLRQFQYRSSVFQWMKVVAIRFFTRHREIMIENVSKEPTYEKSDSDMTVDTASRVSDEIDIRQLLELMNNKRYADTIRRLILEDEEPERYAREIGVTVDNLYNIKKRAMTALSRIAIKHYSYGK